MNKDTTEQIVAICVKNKVDPARNVFAGAVYAVCSSRFHLNKTVAKQYIDMLNKAWRGDKWRMLVSENSYLTEEEKEEWMRYKSLTV